MWFQFFEQNLHFAIYMFTALVFFAVAWLNFDAWLNKRPLKELLKWTGFALAGVSFLIQALIVEQSALTDSLLGEGANVIALALRLAGFAAIIIGQLIDPLQAVPKISSPYTEESDKDTNKPLAAWYAPVGLTFQWALPVAGGAIAWLYYKRATTGLERHYKKVALAFVAFALSDALYLVRNLSGTDNPILYDLVRVFGPVWLLQHGVLLVATLLLGHWVWSYLTKRFFSQLFMIFILTISTVFLIVSVAFTALLLRDIRSNAVSNLEVSTQVLKYAFDAKQSEAAAAAEQVAGSAQIIDAVSRKDHAALVKLTENYLVDKKQSSLIITSDSGQVLLRATEAERWGDSISNDPLVKRALLGIGKSGVIVDTVSGTPVLQVKSAAVIRDQSGKIIGVAMTGLNLDTAFIGGIKRATGLDSSLYADNVLSATTNTAATGQSLVGAKLTDTVITTRVLKEGKPYSGQLSFANQEYIGAFLPVKDPDGVPVAMLSVQKNETTLLQTAGRSIELTLVLTAALLVISVVPVYYITRSLVRQVS